MKFEQHDTVYFEIPGSFRGIGYINGQFNMQTREGERRNWIIGIEQLVYADQPVLECTCDIPPPPKYEYSHVVIPESMIFPVARGYFDSFKSFHEKKVLSESC